MKTLPGKRKVDKKESREKIFPFCPNPWEDQPSKPRSRLPARPKGENFRENSRVTGSILGKRQKSATPGTRTRASERRGRKFYPLGQKIAVLKMANKTLRGRRKTAPERPRRGRGGGAGNRAGSGARGAFPDSPKMKWPSGKSLPRQSRGPGFKSRPGRKYSAQNSHRKARRSQEKIVTKQSDRGRNRHELKESEKTLRTQRKKRARAASQRPRP